MMISGGICPGTAILVVVCVFAAAISADTGCGEGCLECNTNKTACEACNIGYYGPNTNGTCTAFSRKISSPSTTTNNESELDVHLLQEFLTQRGFYNGAINGDFSRSSTSGKATTTGLQQFLNSIGIVYELYDIPLKADGDFGPLTTTMLHTFLYRMGYLKNKNDVEKGWNDASKSAMNSFLRGTDCKYNKRGTNYQGYSTKTISGGKCDYWSNYTYDGADFPGGSVRKAINYCRNIQKYENGPWCRTDNDAGWDYCDIPECQLPRGCTAGLIKGNNKKELLDQADIFACMVACIKETEFACQSFDFTAEDGRCILSTVRSTYSSVVVQHDDDYITCDNIAHKGGAVNIQTNAKLLCLAIFAHVFTFLYRK